MKLDLDRLVSELQTHEINAASHEEIDQLLTELVQKTRSGDVLVFMSSSSFERAQYRILNLLDPSNEK